MSDLATLQGDSFTPFNSSAGVIDQLIEKLELTPQIQKEVVGLLNPLDLLAFKGKTPDEHLAIFAGHYEDSISTLNTGGVFLSDQARLTAIANIILELNQ